ncbi:MAG: capsule assembly Wzi family protein [Gemmatimonadaceae bacterium]
MSIPLPNRWLIATIALCIPPAIRAQSPLAVDIAAEATTNGELERYLRTMQVQGAAPLTTWSLRPLAPALLDRMWDSRDAHPWSGRFTPRDTNARASLRVVQPTAMVRFNSGYAYGSNDGPTWSGRGLTGTVTAGVAGRLGPITMILAPTAFYAQNSDVTLAPNGREGPEAYGHAQFPGVVDRPRRFGDGSYARVDWGESTIRVDIAGAAAGVSTASQWWGPADRYPYLLGNNAGGFPHVFAGTSAPVNLWIARVHAQIIWGQLAQSDYFVPVGLNRPRRFASGLVAVVQPRGLPGLEIGGARFFHAPWPDDGLPGRYLSRPFDGILKSRVGASAGSIPTDDRSIDGENQLASVFARWVFPASAIELYGEYGRDDHNWDGRDVLLEPDHQASLLLGLRKQFRRSDGTLLVVRAEHMDFTANTFAVRRGGGFMYTHSAGSDQGHTLRGQLLGADAGVGSAGGMSAALDWYRPDGRWTVELQREQHQEHATTVGSSDDPRPLDVEYALGAERLLFRGGLELRMGATAAYDFNRDFVRDRANLSLVLGVRGLPRMLRSGPSRRAPDGAASNASTDHAR